MSDRRRRQGNPRARRGGRLWVIYVATLADATYVLHAFAKKTPATSKGDLDLVTARLKDLMQRTRR